MAIPPIDAHKVHFSGENSFLRLKASATGPDTTTCSHWRAYFSPAGPGTVLFVESDATDRKVKIYSDNPGFARWTQTLEAGMRKQFSNPSDPIIAARFERAGDHRSVYQEIVESAEGRVELTWRDIREPFYIRFEPGNQITGEWGVYSCLIPAWDCTLYVNGRVATGKVFGEDIAGHPSSISCLAWGESWLKGPRP
ncbi:MAG: hypothetical protein FJX56_09240 [Alphaproteobacteria bacterium]|nr:hypothetical protein [Alphaproteobacteria bacterium]